MYSGLLKFRFSERVGVYYFINNIHLEDNLCVHCFVSISVDSVHVDNALNTEAIMHESRKITGRVIIVQKFRNTQIFNI